LKSTGSSLYARELKKIFSFPEGLFRSGWNGTTVRQPPTVNGSTNRGAAVARHPSCHAQDGEWRKHVDGSGEKKTYLKGRKCLFVQFKGGEEQTVKVAS
jgi:hypothetical protein